MLEDLRRRATLVKSCIGTRHSCSAEPRTTATKATCKHLASPAKLMAKVTSYLAPSLWKMQRILHSGRRTVPRCFQVISSVDALLAPAFTKRLLRG